MQNINTETFLFCNRLLLEVNNSENEFQKYGTKNVIYALTGGWPRIIFRPSDTFRKDPFVWRRFLSQPDPPRKCLSGDSLSPKLHLSKTRTICFPGFVKQPSCHSTNLRLQFLSPFCNEKTCFSILYDFFLDVLKFVTILLPAIFQNSIFLTITEYLW